MTRGGVHRGARLLLAALCVAAACTGDDADPTPTSPPSDLSEGALRLAVAGPLVLDPAQVNPGSPAELMVVDLLHDGLTALDADGAVVPGLATSWDHDPETSTWTFALAEDAAYTTGEPVTADDVVRSLTRVAAIGPSSLAALRLEAVVGFDEVVAGEADQLAGVRALDPTTVEIRTDEPLATLPAILGAPEMGIVGPGGELDDPAVGLPLSGGWELTEADEAHIALAPRPDRDLEIEGLELLVFDDELAAYDAFDAGEADWALVPAERYEDAVDAHGDAHFAPFQAEVFLGLHLEDPLTSEPLRQAIAAAIDRDAVVAAVYHDLADPLASLVPAGVPGHDPDACGDGPACSHDPDGAEALLQQAFPEGDVPTVAIDFDDSERQRDLVEVVADQLDAVGIPTELRPLGRDDYRRFVASGAHRLFSLGWIGGYASPDAYLAPLFVSGGDDNLTAVADPGIDLALAAARSTTDPASAAEAWAKVEQQVLSSAVVVPIAQFRTQAVVSPRVEGLSHRIDGTVDWSLVRASARPDG